METKFIIEKMKLQNLPAVKHLLENAMLPAEDIDEHWKTFLVARIDEEIIGTIGLEIWTDKALLRSLVVKNDFRNFGIGKELYNKCVELAVQYDIDEIGLLTTTAEGFFAKRGFIKLTKDEIPSFIKQTKEFKVYCPSSSTVMVKIIEPLK